MKEFIHNESANAGAGANGAGAGTDTVRPPAPPPAHVRKFGRHNAELDDNAATYGSSANTTPNLTTKPPSLKISKLFNCFAF